MTTVGGAPVAPGVTEIAGKHPVWLRGLWHYDPSYPYDTETYEYHAWSTTDPHYVHEDVRLSPTNRHDVFLGQVKANLLYFLRRLGRADSVSREMLIRDLPLVPGALRERGGVIPDLALWPPHVNLDDPEGLSWRRHGTPLLVMEALSESTRAKDLEDNPPLYGVMGVQEYWVCDPDRRQWEAVYQAGDGGLWAEVDLRDRDSLYSPVLGAMLRVHAEDGFQCHNTDTGRWMEAPSGVRQEGRDVGYLEGRLEERRRALLTIARLLTDGDRVARLEDELDRLPFAQWPDVEDLYWRYTGKPDG